MLSLYVPPNTKIYINGQETRSVGSQRDYVSFGLENDKTYPYTISALILQKLENPQAGATASLGAAADQATEVIGERLREENRRWNWVTKTVYLRAGERLAVSFSDDPTVDRKLTEVEAKRAYQKAKRLGEDVPALQEKIRKEREKKLNEQGWTASVTH